MLETQPEISGKTAIIDDLGESSLLLPQRLVAALAANDRLKVCFSLLQAAERRADQPADAVPDLSAEQHAVGLDRELDRAIPSSRREADGSLYVWGAARLRRVMLDDLETMRAPLALAHVPEAEGFGQREHSLLQVLPEFVEDRMPKDTVAAITLVPRVRDGASDSVHLLVMDMHRAINALQATLAQETIEGARCWHIEESDRALIRAFMTGLTETARLKFDHPGLGTTATRSDRQLVIQNDIGTTDAHVLVLRVEGLVATVTYTDVHARRLAFFQILFKPFAGAALQIAVDMVRERQITPAEARARLKELDLERIERAHLGSTDATPLACAVSASLGVASGSLVFDASRAAELAAQGRQVILARPDIDTSDVQGIAAAEGVVTSAGGRTSHAAVVARQLGKVCLVGCTALQVRADGTGCTIGAHRFSEGDEITIDGDGGCVYAGVLPLVHERPVTALKALASWSA